MNLTAEQEDYLLEQAREDYYNKKMEEQLNESKER